MTKISAQKTPPPCGCQNCSCRRAPRCRCHVFKALVALALQHLRRAARASAS